MSSVFSEQILTEKLSKLNSTQQSIETLSHWCIFHRSKAELVVATWEKQFHSTEMAQKVPLLYLANDILQNSKRQGNEFVTEFWKVLPAALKDIVSKGDDRGKGVVSRLVAIWEERRVFGSRSKSLRDVMLGEDAPPPLDVSKKRLRGTKSAKRDSKSSRMKLSGGGFTEKIVSAYQLVLNGQSNEETEANKCKSAVKHIRKMEKDVENACSIAKDPKRKTLAKELEEEETLLRQCIEKLKSVEGNREALVTQLREALREQESELESLQTQIQEAEQQAEEAQNMQKRLNNEDYVSKPSTTTTATTLDNADTIANQTPKSSAASIAALVAEKLTASSSSQMIMQSVLSSFAAEAAKTAGLSKSENTSISASDPNAFGPPNPSYNNQAMLPQTTVQKQTQAQTPTSQAQYHLNPNPTTQQFLHPPAMNPYGYGNIPLMPPGPPLPPPPPPHMMGSQIGGPPSQPPPPLQMPQPVSLPPLTPANPPQQSQQGPNFQPLQPPGIMFYGPPHHS